MYIFCEFCGNLHIIPKLSFFHGKKYCNFYGIMSCLTKQLWQMFWTSGNSSVTDCPPLSNDENASNMATYDSFLPAPANTESIHISISSRLVWNNQKRFIFCRGKSLYGRSINIIIIINGPLPISVRQLKHLFYDQPLMIESAFFVIWSIL